METGECDSCTQRSGENCTHSLRECGHHCNHWSHDVCCWCGQSFGEMSDDEVPSTWHKRMTEEKAA